MHRTAALVPLMLATLLAGCTREADTPTDTAVTREPVADAATRRIARADAADAASPLVAIEADGGTGADPDTDAPAQAGRWFLRESDPPQATWGVPGSEGMLTLGCDRAGGKLLLERQAIGVSEDVRVVAVEADGVRIDYPAERREDALAPVLVTRVALDAPILDRLLIARRMVVTAGPDAIATTAPGGALRAVVDACRRGPPA